MRRENLTARDLLKKVRKRYMKSGDFNGLRVRTERSLSHEIEAAAELAEAGLVEVLRPGDYMNIHKQSVPEREVADPAIRVVAKGRSTVNVVSGGPSSSNSVTMAAAADAPPSAVGWTWKAIRRAGSVAVGLATIAAAVFAWPAFDPESWSAFTQWLHERF